MGIDRVQDAVHALRQSGAVLIVSGAGSNTKGELCLAAENATPAGVAFLVRYGSGFLQVALRPEACIRLGLPPMYYTSEFWQGSAFTVSVDARGEVTTGISATDRARTLRVLANPFSTGDDLRRPGHIVPIRTQPAGKLSDQAGVGEAIVNLARCAGLRPAGAMCAVVSQWYPTEMARLPELTAFAERYCLPMVSIPAVLETDDRVLPTRGVVVA